MNGLPSARRCSCSPRPPHISDMYELRDAEFVFRDGDSAQAMLQELQELDERGTCPGWPELEYRILAPRTSMVWMHPHTVKGAVWVFKMDACHHDKEKGFRLQIDAIVGRAKVLGGFVHMQGTEWRGTPAVYG